MKRPGIAFAVPLVAALLAPAGHAGQAADEIEAQADRAFAHDDYEVAEARYREALALRPSNPHALSRLALLLTWKGLYPEAIHLYRKVLSLDPSRMEARRGLATAYTWSEDYASALALYRELLEERPGDEAITFAMAQAQAWSGDLEGASRTLHAMLGRDPRHVKARLLLAQLRFWAGEPSAAEMIYRSLLAERPGDLEALNGLGRVLAASGRLREALSLYDRVLAADPGNRAALEGRARAYHWQGRTPEALAAVRRALELYPDARDARRLGRDIGGALRPSLRLFATTLQDTDDNDLATWGGTYKQHLGARSYIGFSLTHAQTDARFDTDTPVAAYDTLRFIAGRRVSRRVEISGAIGGERTSVPLTDPGGDHTNEAIGHGAGAVTVEIEGSDWFALVASASQERLVGTTQAFMNDVGIRAGTLTLVFRPHPSLRLRLAGQRAAFTDEDDFDVNAAFQVVADAGRGNGRDLAVGSASWKLPLRRPRTTLNARVRWMSYERDFDQGYFDPDHFVASTAGFYLSDTLGKHVYWGGGIDAGVQVIDGFRSRDAADVHNDVFSYRLLAGVTLSESASIEAYYARSDLAVQSTAGFKSTEAGVRLRFRFGQPLGPAAPRPGDSRATGGPADQGDPR